MCFTEYVAITTKAYRDAIDQIWSKYEAAFSSTSTSTYTDHDTNPLSITELPFEGPTTAMRQDLTQVFSRGQDAQYDGLSAGFLQGVRHQSLVRGNAPRHRGLYLGKVTAVTQQRAGQKYVTEGVQVELEGPIKRGDGVVFDHGTPEDREEGGSVYEVFTSSTTSSKMRSLDKGESVSSGKTLLTFGSNAIDYSRVAVGDMVWRSKDPTLDQRLKDSLIESTVGQVPVNVKVSGRVGEPLVITITTTEVDDLGRERLVEAEGRSKMTLQAARSTELTEESLLKAIGTLGGTPFNLINLDTTPLLSITTTSTTTSTTTPTGNEKLFIPLSEIKAARRDAVESLIHIRRQHNRDEGLNVDPSVLHSLRVQSANTIATIEKGGHKSDPSLTNTEPQIVLLCRTMLQGMLYPLYPSHTHLPQLYSYTIYLTCIYCVLYTPTYYILTIIICI